MHTLKLPSLSSSLLVCSAITPSTPCTSHYRPRAVTLMLLSRCSRNRESHVCESRRSSGSFWDSNAETIRTGKFRESVPDEGDDFSQRERPWWSDSQVSEEEYDEFDDDVPEQQLWDRLWIVKIFKAFGWMMPAIIISMLLATGPKAFLMALALPLGQSALSLAIDKVWGKPSMGPNPRSKPTRRKPFSKAVNSAARQEGEDEGQWGYRSWVATNDGAVDKGRPQGRPDFGGWDELDRRDQFNKGPTPLGKTSGPHPRSQMKGKVAKRGRKRDVPLLLRLLIAVFPFLGSWTKIL